MAHFFTKSKIDRLAERGGGYLLIILPPPCEDVYPRMWEIVRAPPLTESQSAL